jgi:hypothetical protein
VALTCLTVALLAGIGIAPARVPRRLIVAGDRDRMRLHRSRRCPRHSRATPDRLRVTCVVLFGCTAMLLYPPSGTFAASPVHASTTFTWALRYMTPRR